MPKYKKNNEFVRLGVPPNIYVGNNFTGVTNSNMTGTIDDNVTSTVKPVDRDKATLEAEVGEAITKPNLTGLYRIGGKTHERGGTPLAAEPGSFIFSNNPDLAFTKDEKELFKFKLGGTHKPKNNTPAKVLFKEVDPKEYNRLMSIIDDPKSDRVAKETAALMLTKYQEKMGKVALLQELKKDEQAPDFAVAPEVNPALEFAENNQEMFRNGGFHLNPAHKGDCTPISKSTCTGKKRQFAINAKNHFKKHENGGLVLFEGGGTAKKVDKAPEGYTFSHEEGGKKYYTKEGGSGQLGVAQASDMQGGAKYEQFLQQQLVNGTSPQELVAKKYISADKVGAYAGYYKPSIDTVYTEAGQNTGQPIQNPAYGGRGQMIYSPDKHGVGEIYYNTRDSKASIDPGLINSAAQYAHIKFRNDFGYTGQEVDLSGQDFQKYLGTTNTFGSGDLMKELQSKSTMATNKFDFGGENPPDKTGKWAFDYNNAKGRKKGWNAMTDFTSPEDYAQAVGFQGNPQDILGLQKFVGKMYPALVDKYHSPEMYGMPAAGNPYDGKLGVRWNDIGKEIQRTRTPLETVPSTPVDRTINPPNPNDPNHRLTTPGAPVAQRPWEGFDFTPNSGEMLSIAAPYLTALSIKPQYDSLIQANTTNLRLDRADNNQEVADMNQRASTEARAAYQNTNPIFAKQIAAQASAQATQGEGQSDQGIRNANTQIANQETQMNAQRQDSTYQFNLGQIQQTDRNNKLTEQRRDYELANAATQSLNSGMVVSRNLEQLGNAATMSAMPYVTNQKDANGNDLVRTDENGNKYTQQGVPFQFNKNRRPIFDGSYGSLNSFGVQSKSAGNSTTISELQTEYLSAVKAGDTKLADSIARGIYALSRKDTQVANSNPFASLLQNMYSGLGQ